MSKGIPFMCRLPVNINDKIVEMADNLGISKNACMILILNDYFRQQAVISDLGRIVESIKQERAIHGNYDNSSLYVKECVPGRSERSGDSRKATRHNVQVPLDNGCGTVPDEQPRREDIPRSSYFN